MSDSDADMRHYAEYLLGIERFGLDSIAYRAEICYKET
jgi:hypothetical protein